MLHNGNPDARKAANDLVRLCHSDRTRPQQLLYIHDLSNNPDKT